MTLPLGRSVVPIAALTLPEWNPRQITDQDFKDLVASIERDPMFLLPRPPAVADGPEHGAGGVVYGGNQRVRALMALYDRGWCPPITVEAPGWVIGTVPVYVSDIPEATAWERALIDNNNAGTYDQRQVTAMLQRLTEQGMGADIPLLGFGTNVLDKLMADVGIQSKSPADGPPAPDAESDPRTTWVRFGDLWTCGDHRVMCGCSDNAHDLRYLMGAARAHLVMTDPPYGIDYSAVVDSRVNQKVGGWDEIPNDASTVADLDKLKLMLLTAFDLAIHFAVTEDAAWFCWHPPMENRAIFAQALETAGVHLHKDIVWSKPEFVFGRWEYHWQYEPCFYGWRAGHHPAFYGDRNQSTVWAVEHEAGFKRGRATEDHATRKPPELWKIAIENHTRRGQIVFDGFAGSGPAVIAAERTGRRAYVMDKDPLSVHIILRDWAAETGRDPVRADGVKWSELAAGAALVA